MSTLSDKFERIGATIVVVADRSVTNFDLNISTTPKYGEHFRLRRNPATAPDFRVLQANRIARHLLLHAPGEDGGQRFLCGHDERHWFVATIKDRVTTITDARRSLLPDFLKDANLSADLLARRHTDAFKRQGEWFFIPTDRTFDGVPIHHGEPLQRNGRSKPHIVSELIRFGGTDVVLWNGKEYRASEWDALMKTPNFRPTGRVERRVKDPEVYVRGKVRHADHATLTLDRWHRVNVNNEWFSTNVSFYD